MLVLRRSPHSPLADEVEAALRDMVAAYRVEPASPDEESPLIRSDDEEVRGAEALRAFLARYRTLVEDAHQTGGDYCHLGANGVIC